MEQVSINHFAVIVATVTDFAFGALWYSPFLFFKAWMKANSFKEGGPPKGKPVLIYGLGFIFSLVITYNLAFFLGDPLMSPVMAILYSLLAGLGWAVMAFFIISLFERRPAGYFAVNGGYMVIIFILKGLIIGLWR